MSRVYQLQSFRPNRTLRIDYRAELNDQQYAAVTAEPGPSLVIAGAGAGKTRTLTYRVAYLLEQGLPPDRVLLLTFTNKASREMMTRVTDLLGEPPDRLWGGTFHSIGHRMLRRHADRLHFGRDFTILDREDSKDLLKACIQSAKIDVKATRFPKPEVVLNILSLSVNLDRPVEETVALHFPYFDTVVEPLKLLAEKYHERKRATNVMDFDDLLSLWLELLRKDEKVLEYWQQRFQYILVDEYQDTNRIQGEIVDLLAARHRHLTVVGDDSQSIYSWRGAHFENILKFPERYPDAKVFKIEVNYRSTPEILQLANACITANSRQFAKKLDAARPSGTKPAVVCCSDASQQSDFIAQRILELRDEGVPLDEIAVLYRSHFHAMELQMELTRRNIPFAITSGVRFFEQAHIKDVAAVLKLLANPLDEVSFKRIALWFKGVGSVAAQKLWETYLSAYTERVAGADRTESGDPDWDLEDEGDEAIPAAPAAAEVQRPLVGESLAVAASKAPKKSVTEWAQWVETARQLEDPSVKVRPSEMIGLFLDALYEDLARNMYPNPENRLDDLRQLSAYAMQFNGLEDFLAQLSLMSNLDTEEEQKEDKDEERLRLSSIHQAKGLEFRVVFVMMLCEGLFPNARALEAEDGEEEERRLFYVALTRAKDELYLSYPLIRRTPGQTGDLYQRPSRFVLELPESLLEEWTLQGGGSDFWADSPQDDFSYLD